VLADEAKVQLWDAILCWSRGTSFLGEENTRQGTILRCLRRSLERFQGVPEEMMTDSMPGVVDRWECDRPVLNARFVDFAAYYRCRVVIAPRASPTWKARCERRYRFHEENPLNGRTIHGVDAYREMLAWWEVEKALARPHPETGEPIAQMMEKERAYLRPLPVRPYDTRDVWVRIVSPTSHVHLATNEYAIPDGHVAQRVYVCADAARVRICDERGDTLIEQERLPDGAGIRQPQLVGSVKWRGRYDVKMLVERLAEWGEAAEDFARGIETARRYAGPELVGLINLQLSWSRDDIVAAMKHARQYGCFETRAVQRILESRFVPRRFEEVMAEATRRRIQEVMQAHRVETRPLSSYASLREGDRSNAEVRKEEHDHEEREREAEDASGPDGT
jgi:hypothetical protein